MHCSQGREGSYGRPHLLLVRICLEFKALSRFLFHILGQLIRMHHVDEDMRACC